MTKTFKVRRSFVDEIRSSAVAQEQRDRFPYLPQIDDPTKAAHQYGLRQDQIHMLLDNIVPGSGQVIA